MPKHAISQPKGCSPQSQVLCPSEEPRTLSMALLAAPSYYIHLSLILLFLCRSITSTSANSITSARFFSDTNCKNLLYTIQTDADSINGSCQILSGVGSVYADFSESGCPRTYGQLLHL